MGRGDHSFAVVGEVSVVRSADKGLGRQLLPRNKMSIRALLSKTERMQTQRTVRYEVTFVKRENVIVKTKLSLS